MRALAFGAVATAAVIAGCSSGSAIPQPRKVAPPQPPTVTMTIADHSRLTGALPWQVHVKTAGEDAVSEVDYLIDGKQRWVEQASPYFFDDDHQLLAPWLLGAGKHVLTARVKTVNGDTANVAAHVDVVADLSQEKAVVGTYQRTVTRADQKRVQSYRLPSKGAFGDVSPTGKWTMHIQSDGEIVVVDPSGNRKGAFLEPFTFSGSTMRLYGAAVWAQPDPSSPNLFCEPEQPGDYRWSQSGTSLTFTNVQKVCADRDIVFSGTWTKV